MEVPAPWRDPIRDPPEEYTEVIVQLDTGRVKTATMMKGRWNTHVPVVLWQPLPPPVKLDKKPRGIIKKSKKSL